MCSGQGRKFQPAAARKNSQSSHNWPLLNQNREFMKRYFFSVAVVLALTVVSASAQTRPLSAHVPFDFTVGQTKLPAGKYIISRTSVNSSDGFFLRDERGHVAVVFNTHAVPALEQSPEGRLEFRRLGDQYFLARFWVSGDDAGRELEQLTLELRIPKGPALQDVSAEVLPSTTQ